VPSPPPGGGAQAAPAIPHRVLRSLLAAACLMCAAAAAAQPVALRGLRLQDQAARPIDTASFEGRALLMNFVFTGCSASCPLQVRELAELQRALPQSVRAKLQILSVSVDPHNDTPAILAAFARRMGADRPGWRFATGAPGQIETLIERMQVMDLRRRPATPPDHRSSLYLFDASGELVQRYAGAPLDRPRLADEITRLVAGPRGLQADSTSNRPQRP